MRSRWRRHRTDAARDDLLGLGLLLDGQRAIALDGRLLGRGQLVEASISEIFRMCCASQIIFACGAGRGWTRWVRSEARRAGDKCGRRRQARTAGRRRQHTG